MISYGDNVDEASPSPVLHPRPTLSPPSTPTRLPMRAAPPGTPLSNRRREALRLEEQRGRDIMAAPFAEDAADVLEDDDWDLADEEEEEEEDGVNELHMVDKANEDLIDSQAAREHEIPQSPSSGHPMEQPEVAGANLDVILDARAPPFEAVPMPVATGVPIHKEQENTPDPFCSGSAAQHPRPPPTPEDIHPNPGVFLIYMFVAWLHLQFHLPFRACNAALTVFGLVIRAFGFAVNPPLISTLGSVLTTMQLEPVFQVLPVCPNCLEVYPLQSDGPTICSRCSSFIYKAIPPNARHNTPLTPQLRFPHKSIESQLHDMLAVPGLEAELDKWRKRKRTPGKYSDMFDGCVPKCLKGHDGHLFFSNGADEIESGPNGELRIGLTLGVDWYVKY